jgi:hypothetical protein
MILSGGGHGGHAEREARLRPPRRDTDGIAGGGQDAAELLILPAVPPQRRLLLPL